VDILSSLAQWVLSFLPAFMLRWYWTEQRLAVRIKTTISSEGQGIWVDAGEIPNFHAWLEVTNFSPFQVEVERLHGELYYGTRICSYIWLERIEVPTASEKRIRIEGTLTDSQALYLRRNFGKNKTKLLINGYLQCRVRGFHIFGRTIESSNAEIVNANWSAP